ncbi:hypothetical protein Tco_1466066 [Tanacetum coccineum]
MSVKTEPSDVASMEARIAEHAAAPTPPLPVVSSPLPLPSPLTTSPTDTGAPLGYRAAGILMRAAVASPPLRTFHLASPKTDIPRLICRLRKSSLSYYVPLSDIENVDIRAQVSARSQGTTPYGRPLVEQNIYALFEIATDHLEGVEPESDRADTTVRREPRSCGTI